MTITNDGATILKQMQVLHPAARMVGDFPELLNTQPYLPKAVMQAYQSPNINFISVIFACLSNHQHHHHHNQGLHSLLTEELLPGSIPQASVLC